MNDWGFCWDGNSAEFRRSPVQGRDVEYREVHEANSIIIIITIIIITNIIHRLQH